MHSFSAGFRTHCVRRFFFACLAGSVAFAFAIAAGRPAFAQTATTTTLTVTSGGSAVTSVSAGTVVTLTATVMAGSTPVTPGQVEFCDTSVSYCTDIFLVELSQLTKTGTAVYKFRPGGGSHSYKAVFLGTKTYAKSSSTVSSLSVTGPFPSVTSISSSAANGNLTLTAQVSGGMSFAPTGSVSFLNTSNSNAVLATAPLGTGAPGMGFSNTYTLPDNIYNAGTASAAVADFNLDGIPDILQGTGTYPDYADGDEYPSFTTLLGNGDGTFNLGPTAVYSLGCCGNEGVPNSMAVGDFNSDGIPDLVMTDGEFPWPVVFLGNGDGSFNSGWYGALCSQSFNNGGCAPLNVAVADFNGDGIPDLVVAGGGQGLYYQIYVQVFLGNGDGTFGNAIVVEENGNNLNGWSQAPLFVAVGDFNRDGIPDLAVANPNSKNISIYLGKGDGTFGSPLTVATVSGLGAYPIAVADFNKDGILDLAVINGSTVSIFLGKGDGTFTVVPQSSLAGSSPNVIVAGDFNGDDIPDLAVWNDKQTVTVLYGNGDGTFSSPATGSAITSYNGSAESLATGDLNGDGVTDLVAVDSVYLAQAGWTATAEADNIMLSGSATQLVQASYPGDANYLSSASGTINVSPEQPAIMTSPAPNSQLSGSSVTFQWTAGGSVTGYKLSVGTTGPGSSNIYASPVLTSTSAAVSGLPTDAVPVYVMLSSQVGGIWLPEYYVYTAAGVAGIPVLTSPAPGSHLSSSTVTFQWTPGAGVSEYLLSVGTKWPGSGDIYGSGQTKATSATVTGLPTDGINVYVMLKYEINGVWYASFYAYTADGMTAPPVLTSPAPGSHLSGSAVTFQWTPGSGVTAYTLAVGTRWPGSADIYGVSGITATSATVSGLPTTGVPVYVMLRYEIEGVWSDLFYTYTAEGTPAPPALTTPVPGSQLSGSTVTFQWTPGSGVTAYTLAVGTKYPGSADIYGVSGITATSATVSGLPTTGVPVYVMLRYQVEGVWNDLFYTYTAQ
jgi:hypothetical protein